MVEKLDLAWEAEVVRRAAERARETGLEPEMMRDVFWRLIGLSRWAAGGGRGR
jgi:chorismate mutase